MASQMQQDHDNDLIRITHYINPHNFWFKHESAYLYNAAEQQYQLELNEFCETTFGRGNITSGIYTPRKVGELVAVFYFQLTRWIRAVVDEIQEDLGGQVFCNLWAIDEGVPVKTSTRYVKPLPESFAKEATSVKHGGLEGILPAECCYDYLEGHSVNKMLQDWSPGVVRVFESCLEEAVSIRLCNIRRYQVTGVDMFFGTMKITSHQNVTNSATDLLRKAGGNMVMLVDHAEFYDKFPLLRTQDMRRFEDNERRENMKYHTNTFRPEYSSRIAAHVTEKTRCRDKYVIEQAREKFLEWDKRNTASSVVTSTNIPMSDYLQVKEPIAPNAVITSIEKGRRGLELDYTELVNESISDDDEEEPPKVELQKPIFTGRPKPLSSTKSDTYNTRGPPAYHRLESKTYEKNVSDLAPELQKIKLRRQAVEHKRITEDNETTFNSNKSTAGARSVLNIVPAGFSMGNVDFSSGSVVLGNKSIPEEKRIMVERFNRDPPSIARTNSKALKSRKPHYQYRREDNDSSFEEEMVRKLTITATKAEDDDDEQW